MSDMSNHWHNNISVPQFRGSFFGNERLVLFVPTLLRGEELYTQMGFFFFCSVNFRRSIHSS